MGRCIDLKKMKSIIFDNVYVIFSALFLIICSVTLLVIKSKITNLVAIIPEAKKPVGSILIIIGAFIIVIFIIVALFIYILRAQVSEFSNEMCTTIDRVISKEENIDFDTDKETLLSKLQHKFKLLVELMESDENKALKEKDNIKALIADISHQIKTPITNIAMYNDTLIERKLDESQQKLFLNNMKFQVDKLEWLVQALIKMSRLESNIIALTNNETFINTTIANALSGVYLKAEEKDIKLNVSCPSDLKLNHDSKWTSEALFNILENGVKYTNPGGSIDVVVSKWELFSKIDIIDTGIGIDKDNLHNIFKRFYRESEVSEVEGVGIGLYLANEIITKQGGYIKVESEKNTGSIFSVFLKN